MLRGERGLDEGLCQPPSLAPCPDKSPTQRIIRKWEQKMSKELCLLMADNCWTCSAMSCYWALQRQHRKFSGFVQEASFFFCLSDPSLVAKPWHIFPAPRVSSLVKLPNCPRNSVFCWLGNCCRSSAMPCYRVLQRHISKPLGLCKRQAFPYASLSGSLQSLHFCQALEYTCSTSYFESFSSCLVPQPTPRTVGWGTSN